VLLNAEATGSPPVIVKLISTDLLVEAGTVVLGRNHVLADGVTVLIEDTGELLLL